MLTDNDIKGLYFQTDNKRPGAILAVEVDIIQFAHNIERAIAETMVKKERKACIDFVRSLNSLVADKLEKSRPPM